MMKSIKKLLCLAAVVCLLLGCLPVAMAEETTAEEDPALRFEGKSWEQVMDEFIESKHADPDYVAAGYCNTVTGEEYYHNADKYMIAASMFKVPLNMVFAERISNGEMDWDTNIRGYRYNYLLRGTIIDSNNDLAEALWREIGVGQYYPYHYYREVIAPYMGEDAENVDQTYYKNNLFTPRQMIHCLKLLYDNPDRFPRIIDTMKEAEPHKYFLGHDQKVEVAHKYGYVVEEGYLYLNDCGICFTEDPICIVCFTQGIHEPYTFLSDFCTLMIDYAEYSTQQRHEREQQEAREAAIRAMNEPASEEQPQVLTSDLEKSESQPVSASEVQAAAEKNSGGLRLPIPELLILAAAVWALITVIAAGRKKKLKTWWAAAAVVFTALALLVCLSVKTLNPTVAAPETAGNPQETVQEFLDALLEENYDQAYARLYDYASLGLENQPQTEAAQLMAEALRESYAYTLYGDCRIDGLKASQQVLLDVLDLTALQEDLKSGTEEAVERISSDLPESRVVDENGQYLPEITDQAYVETLRELLDRPGKYMTTVGVELQLNYTVDGWRIVTSRELLYALSGCTSYSRGGNGA